MMDERTIQASEQESVPGPVVEALLPMDHRDAWAAALPNSVMLPIRVADSAVTSIVVQQDRSRVLPGHRFLRVARFGHGWPATAWDAILKTIASAARADSRVLRLNVEVFLRSDKEEMRTILRQNGFVPAEPRSYRHTLTLSVDAPDEVLLCDRKSLRKRLREAAKAGVAVQALTDAKYADRIAQLQRIAMERSGGSFRIPDWLKLLRLSADHPELSRVVGLFPSGSRTSPDELLGFAWGCMHGDHAEYRAAGTAELPHELRAVSISHPLLWDLIQWSRENGATWFDMGGVTLQSGSDDPLAGISAAKRVFSETVEEVGEEWMLEPRPWKNRAAKALGALAAKLRPQGSKTA